MATAYEILISPAKRYELTALLMEKPQYRYIVPTAQSVGNMVGSVLATLSWANRMGYTLPSNEFATLLRVLSSDANEALSVVGVTVSLSGQQNTGAPLQVTTTVEKGERTEQFSYTFNAVQADFSGHYSEMSAIASARYARYIEQLTNEDIKAIIELAKIGYAQFLTGDSAKEQKARIKHLIAMERLKANPEYYKNRLNAEYYATGYEQKVMKFKEASQNISLPAILFGFEFTKAVVKVL